ncbi:hypothetical protein QQS21_010383 [Conoideocrella luteorostrata]|uniref:BZIP domain-containing protein n=1 Tax=Conoideocrella luteorostrata TaxID=1105319 RepID=A0AAJ0FPF8_9HYPO|nr:hypothetical protein QQS21_010383 [Conoideocrella luteorostrata]
MSFAFSPPDSELANMTKPKRSRASLTALQLEHKRAHDREAQRANRRRVKDRILRLERELEEKRGHIGSSRVYQELLRRNRILEEEVAKLKNSLGAASTNGSSPGSVSESSGFGDYHNPTEALPYPSPNVYSYPMSAAEFPDLTGCLPHNMSAVYNSEDKPSARVTSILPDNSSPTSYKTPLGYSVGRHSAGEQYNSINYVTSTSGPRTAIVKSGPVHHNGMPVEGGTWNLGQLQHHASNNGSSCCGPHLFTPQNTQTQAQPGWGSSNHKGSSCQQPRHRHPDETHLLGPPFETQTFYAELSWDQLA